MNSTNEHDEGADAVPAAEVADTRVGDGSVVNLHSGLQSFYRELDRRIETIPDGPSAALNPPRWMRFADLLGLLGAVTGLLPSVLIMVLPPQEWMVLVARIGLVGVALGWGASTLYRFWQFVRSVRSWRVDQADQLDHDFSEWHRLCESLADHPQQLLDQHLRWLQQGHTRLTAKLGFLAGGIDKLGILPLLVALAVQAKVAADVSDIPKWQLLIGAMAGITYFIALVGSLMRLRMQLYESAIEEALKLKDGR